MMILASFHEAKSGFAKLPGPTGELWNMQLLPEGLQLWYIVYNKDQIRKVLGDT